MPLESLRAKYEAFNWHVLEIDGNNIAQFVDAIWEAHAVYEKPTVIIAHTVPGKGVDFMEFDYPDASDPFWEKTAGIRMYGVRAERSWWDMKDQNIHGFKFQSPNIQWYVLNKYNKFPSKKNIYYWYFRELPLKLRKSKTYDPPPNHFFRSIRAFFGIIIYKVKWKLGIL